MDKGKKSLSTVSLVETNVSANTTSHSEIIAWIQRCDPPTEAVEKIILGAIGDVGSFVGEDICEDLVFDVIDLLNESECPNIHYPPADLTSSSVISLMPSQELSKNKFVQSLMQSWRATNRQFQARLRVNLITNEGNVNKAIEFTEEKDYWMFLAALRKSASGDDEVFYVSKCLVTSGNDQSNKKSGVFSMMGNTSNSDTIKCKISNSLLSISEGGVDFMKIFVKDLKAAAISMDYEPVKPFIIEAALKCSADVQLCPVDSDGKMLPMLNNRAFAISQYSPRDTLCIPISVSELNHCRLDTELDHIGIVSTLRNNNLTNEFDAELPLPIQSLCEIDDFSNSLASNKKNIMTNKLVIKEVTFKSVSLYNASYRLVILGAEGFSSQHPPSAYCTVYLVNRNGDKLTANIVEARTDPIAKDANPQWNKEFIMHIEDNKSAPASESPFGVMIKIRDSAAGIFKHRHLGQVIVPINCFIFQTEATFCLPIESTSKMLDGDKQGAAGQIHLTTQLVPIADPKDSSKLKFIQRAFKLPPSHAASSGTSRVSREVGSVNSAGQFQVSESTTVSIGFTLKRASPWSTWWPCRTLQNIDCRGHLSLRYNALVVRLQPGVGGVLSNSLGAVVSEDDGVCIVPILWNHVTSVIELSEAVLLVSVMISECTSSPSEVARNSIHHTAVEVDILVGPCLSVDLHQAITSRISLWGIRSHLKSLADAVYAEFPSKDLVRRSTDLHNFSRANSTQNSRRSITGNAKTEGVLKEWNPDSIESILSLGRIVAEMAENVIVDTEYAIQQHTISVKNATTESAVAPLPFSPSLELPPRPGLMRSSSLQTRTPPLPFSPLSGTDDSIPGSKSTGGILLSRPSGSDFAQSMEGDAKHEQLLDTITYVKLSKYLRAKVYVAMVIYILKDLVPTAVNTAQISGAFSRSDTRASFSATSTTTSSLRGKALISSVPDYSSEGVKRFITQDLAHLDDSSSQGEMIVERLGEHLRFVLEAAIRRLRDYVLCSYHYGNFRSLSATQSSSASVNRSTPPRPPTRSATARFSVDSTTSSIGIVRQCVDELVSCYHNQLRQILLPWVGSRDSFVRLRGMHVKMELLKLIIDNNSEFHSRLEPVVMSIGLRCQPRALLLEPEGLNLVVDWFALALVTETKNWLNNTITTYSKQRKNDHKLPWDIIELAVGGRNVSSDLPEAILSVLKVYLSLCTDDFDISSMEFIETHKDFVRKHFSYIVNSKVSAPRQPAAPVEGQSPRSGDALDDTSVAHSSVDGSDNDDDDDHWSAAASASSTSASHGKEMKRTLSKQKSLMQLMKPKLKKSGTLKDLMSSVGLTMGGKAEMQSQAAQSSGETSNKDEEGAVFRVGRSDIGDYRTFKFPVEFNWGNFVDENIVHLLQNTEKSLFFLKLNEKILWSFCRCMSLLAEEYKRALQRKHWERAEASSAEEAANISFILSVGNDSYRVLNVHIRAQFSVRTLMPSPLEIFHEVIVEFVTVMELSSKLLARILFSPLQPLMLDFDSIWDSDADNCVAKLITAPLLRAFQHVNSRAEEKLYTRLVGHCAEICVLRYLLMLRKRVESASKFTVADVDRFHLDIEHICDFFRLDETLGSGNDNGQHFSTYSHDFDPSCSLRCSRALQSIRDARDLLRLNLESEDFVVLCRSLVKRYKDSRSCGYVNTSQNLLSAICINLRPDVTDRVAHLIQIIHDNHGNSLGSKPALTKRCSISDLADDLLMKVFGNKADDETGGLTAVLQGKKPSTIPKVVSMPSGLVTGTTFKQLREKAADFGILNSRGARKQDEVDTETLRTLGLESDAADTIISSIGSSFAQHGNESEGEEGSVYADSASIADDAIDLVTVQVHCIKLRGIKSLALFGTANPYISLSLGSHRVKSTVIWGKKDSWEWNEVATSLMSFKVSWARLQQLSLLVQVFDKERIRRKRILGSLNLSLTGIEGGSSVANWFALDGTGDDNSLSEIFLDVRVVDARSQQMPSSSGNGHPKPLLRSWSSNFRLKT